MNDESHNIFVMFLCIFLVGTGAVAIISALNRLGTPSDGAADSALETKLFKWSAPAGLVYGVVAILLVVGIIKFWSYPEKEGNIVADINAPIRAALKSTESTSVANGKILITYNRKSFALSNLQFQGIYGVSSSSLGPFKGLSRQVQRGDQFFVKLHDHSVWGINVLAEQGGMIIEAFPMTAKDRRQVLSSEFKED